MNPKIIYPVPFDKFSLFKPFIERFTDTFRQFEPDMDYEILAVVNWGAWTDEMRKMFLDLKVRFLEYFEHGCDFGSTQSAKYYFCSDDLLIQMTTRCYFHREGWLERFMEAREKHGPGLYGASASKESGVPHICTRAFGLDGFLWHAYPYRIDTRAKGQWCETGEWCLTTWIRERNLPTLQVTFDGDQEEKDWRTPDNIFRKGDQSNMLVWDKHTDAYKNGDDAEKERLVKMVEGVE